MARLETACFSWQRKADDGAAVETLPSALAWFQNVCSPFEYNIHVRLIVMLKLQPSPEQAMLLRETVEAANAAANQISATAWQTQTFGQFDLHKLSYAEARLTSGLSAQIVVRLIAKVADAYKLDHARQRRFRPLGGIAY